MNLVAVPTPFPWKTTYNTFYDVELTSSTLDYFKESLLQIENERLGLLIDLGWYPEFDISGRFTLLLIKDRNWQKPLLLFESQCKKEMIEKIKEILQGKILLKL